MTHVRQVALTLTLAVLSAGCGLGLFATTDDATEDAVTSRPTREEVRAAGEALAARLLEEPDVTAAEAGTLSAAPVEDGSFRFSIEADGIDDARVAELCDLALEHVWMSGPPGLDAVSGGVTPGPDEVRQECSEVLGLGRASLGPDELEARYGPRPGTGDTP